MDTRESLSRHASACLALAEELQNISKACKVAKVSRSHYYEIKNVRDLRARWSAPRQRSRVRMPNQTSPELEAKILEMTEQFPTYSYIRISGSCAWPRAGIHRRCALCLGAEWLGAPAAAPVVAGSSGARSRGGC